MIAGIYDEDGNILREYDTEKCFPTPEAVSGPMADYCYNGEILFDGRYTCHGIFLTWIINNNLHGEIHRNEISNEAISKILSRQITGGEFFSDNCHGVIIKEDFNKEGYDFACDYLDLTGPDQVYLYLYDYNDVFSPDPGLCYEIEDTWENYDKIKPILDQRYSDWKNSKI